MATITWNNGATGDWTAGVDWGGGTAPGSGDDAVINAPGTVTISTSVAANSLTIDQPGAEVTDTGTLTLGTVLALDAGTFALSGIVTGGTIEANGGTALLNGGTLNGVTWKGVLALAGSNQSLFVENGLTLQAAGGGSPGRIDLSGANYSGIDVLGSGTLDNATLNFGSGVANSLTTGTGIDSGNTLTLGRGFTIDASGYDILGFQEWAYSADDAGDTLDNAGVINASFGPLVVFYGTFNNTGSINVSNGDMVVYSAAFSNSGSITVSSGLLAIDGAFNNTGTVTINAGATLELQDSETTAQLGNIIFNGGTLEISGTLDNTGQTLDVGNSTALSKLLLYGGTVRGGTIRDAGSGTVFRGASLDGVTYEGALDLSPQNSSVTVTNGLMATGADGTGPGAIVLGSDSTIAFNDTQTFDNATITLGYGSSLGEWVSYATYAAAGYANTTQTLTLGPNLTINATGNYASLGGGGYGTGAVVNDGTINVGVGNVFTVSANEFTNDGTIALGAGATLNVDGSFTSLSGNTLTGGTYDVGAGASFNFTTSGPLVTLSADLTLSGAASEVYSGGKQIETTLTTIGASGALRLLAGRDYTTTNSLDVFGVLQLAGGTLDPPPVTIEVGGTLTGNGVIAGLVIDNGLIDVTGGTLDLTQGVTGSGTIEIKAGATLELGAPLDPAIHVVVDPGGTVVYDTICFCPCTLIRTPHGERAVESLAIGDLVLTTEGEAQPVLWVGRQTVSRRFADPLRVLPIRISAGALDENLPVRDLLVSTDHALLVGGVLIQAGALVNGSTILREENVPVVFTYYHVELAGHSLILAEGVPAETFVDNVDRMGFDNWDEYLARYPEGREVAEMPLPRAKSHRQVPMAIRRHLAARAAALHPAGMAA